MASLIEVVNRFGSFFYGSILGVFLLAMMLKTLAVGAFFGLIAGSTSVVIVPFRWPSVSYLVHNLIAALTVRVVGLVLCASLLVAVAAEA